MGQTQAGPDHPLTRVAAGAISGGALWWSLDQMSTVNGVGWLTRSGPPWSWVGLFVAIGAVVGGAIGLRSHARARAHSREVQEQSRRLGFAYQDRADDLLERYPGAAALPVFRHWHAAADRATGEVHGVAVEVFDLTGRHTSEGSEGDSTTTTARQTIVFLPGADLPDFELRAKGLASWALETFGVEGMTFDARDLAGDDARAVEAFLRLYRVERLEGAGESIEAAPGDDLAVRRVFSPEVMRLLTARPGWSAQACGGHLALWRGSGGGYGALTVNGLTIPLGRGGGFAPADRRAALAEDAVAIVAAMRAAGRRPASAPVVPARPDGAPAVQRARATGAGLGGAAGGVFGFFGGFGLFVAWMFSQEGTPGLLMMLSMPLLAFGGAAAGALVGALLGRRFLPIAADAAPAPSLRRPPASGAWPILDLFAGSWPVLGVFVGLLLGGGLGIAGTLLMAANRKYVWLFPILFFGGAGGGGGLGLLLVGLFAHRRRRRRERSPSA
jgi:hypothetical protein